MNTKLFILFSFLILFINAMPIKDESNCFLCKIVITNAEKFRTTNDIENYLENKACNLPLAKEFKNECRSFISKNAPALVSKIAQKQSPTKACEEINICKQAAPLLKLNAVKPSSQQPIKGALECTICTTVINLAESILGSNASETAIEDFLQNTVCGILPGSLKTDCDALVQAYLPALVAYIQQGESGSVACAQLGLCNSTSTVPLLKLNAVKPSSQQPIKGALECTICTTVINLAESILGSNASETAIEDFLQNTVCGILPGSLKTDCDALVQAYLPALVAYIQQGESGSVACAQLGLCNSTSTVPLLKLNAVKPSSQQPIKGALECTICTTVINLAESILGSNASETAIEDFLQNTVCGILPGSLKTDCDALVQAYLPALVAYIQQGESGSVACAQLGLCNSTSTAPLLKLNAVKPTLTRVRGALECTVCQVVVTLAEDFLGANATQQSIENFLENTVCTLVPSSYTSVCDAFVQQFTPSLVVYIQHSESPSIACNSIGVCNSTSIVPPVRKMKN